MTAITSTLDHPYTQALAWALIHFLWQGAVIAVVAFALWRINRASASVRYGIGVAALGAMLAAPALTFAYLVSSAPPSAASAAIAPGELSAAGASGGVLAAPGASPLDQPQSSAGSNRPSALLVVLAAWLAGVVFLSLRLLGGWVTARRLARRAVRPVAADIQALAKRVAGRLALDRLVTVFESSAVTVPMMVGWIKPAVLLPVAALSGLTPTQIEALLAHELAHVRRHDYLVNLLQSIVETLLFYHPAMWWMSRQVRREREHCCDDLAVGVCDRLVYVTALADLASMTPAPRLALAATDGSLVGRIRRLLGGPRDDRETSPGWISLCLVLLLGIGIPATVRTAETPGRQVVGAVRDGIAGGIVGGVAGGVREGVVGGVPGGVAGGIVGAVIGGVREGVVGGVPGGIVGGVDVDQDRQQSEQELRKTADRVLLRADELQHRAAMTAALEAQLSDLSARVAALANAKQRGGDASTIAALEAQLREAERNLREAVLALQSAKEKELKPAEKRLVEVDAQALERTIAEARHKLQGTEERFLVRDLADAQRNLERTKVLTEKGLVTKDVRAQAELNLLLAEQARQASDPEARRAITEQIENLRTKISEQNLERTKMLTEKGLLTKEHLDDMKKQIEREAFDQMDISKLELAKMKSKLTPLSEHAVQLLEPLRRADQNASDRVLIDVLKSIAKESNDADRADVLITIARERALTSEMVTLYLSAATGIRSDYDRTRVFAQPVRLKAGR